MRRKSCRSGERTKNDGRAWRMSPTGGGGSRSGASSVTTGLVATETWMLLGGGRIPAFVDVGESGLGSHVGRSVDELVQVDRAPAAAEDAQGRSERRSAPAREQVGVVEVDVYDVWAERRLEHRPRGHAQRVCGRKLQQPRAAR